MFLTHHGVLEESVQLLFNVQYFFSFLAHVFAVVLVLFVNPHFLLPAAS